MAWRDSLEQLKAELTQARATRMERLEAYDQEVAAEREELLSRHDSLNITSLVLEMNEVLLDGQGEVETTVEWETGEEEEELIYDDETADVISTALSWDEGEELGGRRRIGDAGRRHFPDGKWSPDTAGPQRA